MEFSGQVIEWTNHSFSGSSPPGRPHRSPCWWLPPRPSGSWKLLARNTTQQALYCYFGICCSLLPRILLDFLQFPKPLNFTGGLSHPVLWSWGLTSGVLGLAGFLVGECSKLLLEPLQSVCSCGQSSPLASNYPRQEVQREVPPSTKVEGAWETSPELCFFISHSLYCIFRLLSSL